MHRLAPGALARALALGTAGAATLAVLPITAGAATIEVTTGLDQFGLGDDCALREAVEAARTNQAFGGCPKGSASSRDTIKLEDDVALIIDGGGPTNSTGDLDVTGGGKLTLLGAPDPEPSPPAIVQDGSDRILEITKQRGVKIQGVDMHGGGGVDAGGAVRVAEDGQTILSDVHLHDNEAAARGGAIACEGCRSLRLEGAFNVEDNAAFAAAGSPAEGGAIWSDAPTALRGEVGVLGLEFTNAHLTDNSVVPGNGVDGFGGAIFTTHDLEVRDVLLAESDVFGRGFGGAVAMRVPFGEERRVEFRRSTLMDNSAEGSGGAISATADGTGTGLELDVRSSAIVANAANGDPSGVASGGGIETRGAHVTLTDSAVAGNVTTGTSPGNVLGGGIRMGGGTDGDVALKLIRSSVTSNQVEGGSAAGIYVNDVSLTAINATIAGNDAGDGSAGGLYLGGPGRITHSTIAGNVAAGGGQGIFHPSAESTVRLRASIMGQASSCQGPGIESAGYNVEPQVDGDCNLDAPTDSHANPFLQALTENGSPAVGFGDAPPSGPAVIPQTHGFSHNSSAANIVPAGKCEVAGKRLKTDARGAPRPAEDGCDAGAIERTACLGQIVGGPGAAIGTKGDDVIQGSLLSIVFAQGGDDYVLTAGGADRICAGSGDDELLPGNGPGEVDLIAGGPGTDLLSYDGTAGGEIDLAAGIATGSGIGADTFTGIENARGSDSGDDTVLGDGGRNRLIGGTGQDIIRGRGGIDVIDARDGEPDIEINCGPGKNSRERALVDELDPAPKSC